MSTSATFTAPTVNRAASQPRKLRVVFLSADSGGGHHGTARAFLHHLQTTLERPVEAECLDVYQGRLRVLPWLSRIRYHFQRPWQGFFRLTEQAWVLAMLRRVLAPRLTRSVLSRIESPPDLLVATHFAGAQILADVAAGLARKPATLVLATDYLPHRCWFGDADALLVSEMGQALARRFCAARTTVVPAPLLPCLPPADRPPAQRSGQRLRMLVVMGADGTGGNRLRRLLRELGRCAWSNRLDIEVVCGRNERLLHSLVHDVNHGAWGLHLKVIGFATDLPHRIDRADICLLRASPLVMTEVAAAGVPTLAFDWHAHKAANARLLESWGCGRATKSLRSVVDTLEEWVLVEGRLAQLRAAAARNARRAFGARQVTALLATLRLEETVT